MVDFATNPTTTTTYNDTVYSAIISDEVLDALMAAVVTPQLLSFYDLAGQPSKAIDVPKADKFTAAALTEGTETSNTALTTAKVTGTTAEIGIQATITDVLELSDIPAAHGARLRQLGRALGDKLDVDITALFASFSQGIGATGVDLSLQNIIDGLTQLDINDASSLGQVVMVHHPRGTGDIRNAIDAEAGVAYSEVAGERAANIGQAGNGFFGSWFGVPMFMTSNCPTVNAGADRSGGLFVRDYALAYVNKWPAKVESLRWAPIRGWVLVATANYAVFEVEDLAGQAITSDA
jgi:N4-gp56 family major capsid protein